LLRYYLLLEQGEIRFASGFENDARDFSRHRTSRTSLTSSSKAWRVAICNSCANPLVEDWFHDTAVVTGPERHYIIVAMTHHPNGDAYLENFARAVDDLMIRNSSFK